MDFHAARLDVVEDFESIKPGETKNTPLLLIIPVYFYHCGSDPMIQHIARGMYGVIIVDPKDANALPKADREYVLIQAEHYENPDDKTAMMQNKWSNVVFNGGFSSMTRCMILKPPAGCRPNQVNGCAFTSSTPDPMNCHPFTP